MSIVTSIRNEMAEYWEDNKIFFFFVAIFGFIGPFFGLIGLYDYFYRATHQEPFLFQLVIDAGFPILGTILMILELFGTAIWIGAIWMFVKLCQSATGVIISVMDVVLHKK